MKLAEALLVRADMQRKLEQLKARIALVVKVQEGEKPAEDPKALHDEYLDTALKWKELVARINFTNVKATVEGSKTIMEAIAERDSLVLTRGFLEAAIAAAVISQNRQTKSEVKYLRTIDAADYQKQHDRVAKELRELDAKIQSANWGTELT
jgi:hypothetical protein